ncbi:MAG TPA: hypothetical protein VI932_04060, partial [Bacteroidota bacterium]|nr:hypothetical protein [Bacteroidota bacterium]
LLLAMHGAAHASGLRTLDMLRGDEKYKFELTDRSERLANVTVAVGDAGRAKPPVRARILSSLGLAAFLARREMRLFGVQIRHHGAARGLASYLRFRGARYKRKFFSGTPGGGPDRGAQGERSGDRV